MQDPVEHRAHAPAQPAENAKPGALALSVNGKPYFHDGDPDMPLLWFLRDSLRLTGTKFGCGVGACGACTVLVDGKATRSCLLPMKAIAGHRVVTIEGLESDRLHPVQQAWLDEDVPQCGYCQAGQIMAATELLMHTPKPGDADIVKISNLCRCGTYPRIRRAILRAATLMNGSGK